MEAPPTATQSIGLQSPQDVTQAALLAMAQTPDPRLREIMAALVSALHRFAGEVGLTMEEWEIGIDFLIRLGQSSNARHNEMVLASDALGLSTFVCLQNGAAPGVTDPALLGPFWRAEAPICPAGTNITRSADPGEPLFVSGRVRSAEGGPIAGAVVDVWQASPKGLYENQDPDQADMNLRGRFRTDESGAYAFRTVQPAGYPVPVDGPVGDLLRAQRRPHYRPAHLHFMISAPGFRTLITQIFPAGDPYLEQDVVFGVTGDLIGVYEIGEGPAPAGDVEGPWRRLMRDFILAPGESRFPKAPIG